MSFVEYFDLRTTRFASWYRSERIARMLGRGAIWDRLAFAIRVARELQAKTVLDIGCGTGPTFGPLVDLGVCVTAIDPAPHMVDCARTEAARVGGAITVLNTGWEQLASEGATAGYDLAIALGVFDYVTNPADLLATMRAESTHAVASFPSPGVRLSLRRVRYGRHGVEVCGYSPEDIRALAATAGYRILQIDALERAGHAVHFVAVTR